VGPKILVVDDERATRLVIRHMLIAGAAAYEIDEAVDGQEALDVLRGGTYVIVITDLMMPRLDGLELLGAMHAEFAGLPVVVLTALGDERHILSCFARGAWDYMLKPVDVRQLQAVVRRAIVAGRDFRQEPGDFEICSADAGSLEFQAASDIEYVHRFRRFTEVLLRARLPSHVREDIRLAIEEIGMNAIEWGNRGERAKRVRMAYRLDADRITFEIEDQGKGFRRADLPDPSADPLEHLERRTRAGKRPGGYGLQIIEGVMDSVTYSPKGNAVVMTKFLS
jgi:CheY-like chemotaxis protein/anti-sigma regulatory factor (Ser/Thr protein kinase)